MLLGLFFVPISAQTLIYEENFNNQLGQGLTGPVTTNQIFTSTNGKWLLETPSIVGIFDANDHARVEDSAINFPFTGLPLGDALQFRDVDEVVTFRTRFIDISSYDSARFSLRLFEVGSLESSDSVQVAYILDGVRTRVLTLFDDFSDQDGTGSSSSSDPGNVNPIVIPVSVGSLTGDSIAIEVLVDCNSSSELYHVDSVEVFGFGFNNAPPVVTCPAGDTIYTDPGFCDVGFPDFRSQATIVDDTDPNPSVFQSPGVSDPVFGPFYLPGVYTITISATDLDGATGSCQFNVTVLDTVPPTLNCASDQTLDCTDSLPDYRGLVSATGICATIDTVIQIPAPGAVINTDTVVTFTVVDSFGISSSCSINVILTGSLPDTTTVNVESCDPMEIGMDTMMLVSQSGCDSLVITTTTLLHSDTTTLTAFTTDSLQVGADTLTLSNQAGCDSLVITNTVLDTATNVKDLSGEIRVFPNPTEALLTIDMGIITAPVQHIILRDVQGREIIRTEPSQAQSRLQLDLTGYTKGIYLMEVQVQGYPSFYTKILRE